MPPSRLVALRDLFQKDPTDAFAGYGLAMELAKRPETEPEAVETFRRLLAANPDYLPAYLQFGLLLARRGEAEAAKDVYERGIALATRVRDAHTREELESALGAL